MMIPTAMSTTFPLMANVLNSWIIPMLFLSFQFVQTVFIPVKVIRSRRLTAMEKLRERNLFRSFSRL